MAGMLGKLDPVKHRCTLDFSKYIIPDHAAELLALPTAPDRAFWEYAVPDKVWGSTMFGNATAGDCVLASFFHQAMNVDANTKRKLVIPSEADILNLYSQLTGWDPYTGNNDTGLVMTDTFEIARITGLLGRTILGWAKVDWTDPQHSMLAVALFSGMSVGIQVPQSAMDQFDAGQPWNTSSGAIVGGHNVPVFGEWYDGGTAITWAKRQPYYNPFLMTNCDEAYVLIFPEWFDAAGKTPKFALDLATLEADMNALG